MTFTNHIPTLVLPHNPQFSRQIRVNETMGGGGDGGGDGYGLGGVMPTQQEYYSSPQSMVSQCEIMG